MRSFLVWDAILMKVSCVYLTGPLLKSAPVRAWDAEGITRPGSAPAYIKHTSNLVCRGLGAASSPTGMMLVHNCHTGFQECLTLTGLA